MSNWHWKNKNCTRWGKEWLERELPTLTISEGSQSASVTNVTLVDGDIELSQRKSKLITIFDFKLELEWAGVADDSTEVKGRLEVPEVSHEITVDQTSDYVFNWVLSTSSSEPVDALYSLVRAKLSAAIQTKLAELPAQMIEVHGGEITVSVQPSRASTPAPAAPVSLAAAAAAKAPVVKKAVKTLNTSTVKIEATFMASADDLFDLLTNENRIPTWSRASAKSTPQAGAEYSLFGGGVVGKYQSLTKPTEIVQDWILKSPTWPAEHVATLKTSLEQSSDSTTVTFNLSGVPKGIEDEIRRNIEGYYVHGLKSIGYVQIVPSPSYSMPSRSSQKATDKPEAGKCASYTRTIGIAVLVFVASLAVPYLSSSK